MYYVIYPNGASQYCEAPNTKAWVSMISAGVCLMVINSSENKALILSQSPEGKKTIGWAVMDEFGGYSDEEIELLE